MITMQKSLACFKEPAGKKSVLNVQEIQKKDPFWQFVLFFLLIISEFTNYICPIYFLLVVCMNMCSHTFPPPKSSSLYYVLLVLTSFQIMPKFSYFFCRCSGTNKLSKRKWKQHRWTTWK